VSERFEDREAADVNIGPEEEEIISNAIAGLVEELENQIQFPQGNDPRNAAFALALHGNMARSETKNSNVFDIHHAIRGSLKDRLRNGKSLLPWNILNVLRLAAQKQVLLEQLKNIGWRYSNSTYPWQVNEDSEWTTTDLTQYAKHWQIALEAIAWDDGTDPRFPPRRGLGRAAFLDDIANKDTMTSKAAERYISFVPLQKLGLMPEQPRSIDIGSGYIGIKIFGAPPELGKFGAVDVLTHVGSEAELDGLNLSELRINKNNPLSLEFSQKLNQTVAQGLDLGKSFAVDIADLSDPNIYDWARTSHYPRELLDRENSIGKFDKLANLKVSNVAAIQANIADKVPPQIQEDIDVNGKLDTALLCATWHQSDENERIRLLEGIKQIANKLFVLDFGKENPNIECGIEFFEHFTVEMFPFRLFYYDLTDENPEPQTLIAWTGGRCDEAVLVGDIWNKFLTKKEE
jgi:hypothetical protein